MRLTASNIISEIDSLDKNVVYDYINKSTKTKLVIKHVQKPEGPIEIGRFNPSNGENIQDAKTQTISSQMIWRIANSFVPNNPINFDRVLGGSYNTRSALETLLAYTPNFFYCYPGRIEVISESSEVRSGHKHLLWTPEKSHRIGIKEEIETNLVISEGLIQDVSYEALDIPSNLIDEDLGIEVSRRHAQIQIALMEIGTHLGFKNWIAKNDQAIIYKDKPISDFDSVVPDLKAITQLSAYSDAIKSALYIDCIWFQNHRFIPAVMEIEHSTGITSGLSRMKTLKDHIPQILTRYVVVASDNEREKLRREANKNQFRDLQTRFFPYSAVEELFYLCNRRKIKGVTQEFLDSFMEEMVEERPTQVMVN